MCVMYTQNTKFEDFFQQDLRTKFCASKIIQILKKNIKIHEKKSIYKTSQNFVSPSNTSKVIHLTSVHPVYHIPNIINDINIKPEPNIEYILIYSFNNIHLIIFTQIYTFI